MGKIVQFLDKGLTLQDLNKTNADKGVTRDSEIQAIRFGQQHYGKFRITTILDYKNNDFTLTEDDKGKKHWLLKDNVEPYIKAYLVNPIAVPFRKGGCKQKYWGC